MDDAVELLHSIDKPLAVLSICGPYRSGKSYFISRALGSPGAFKLGHSMQASTRGIWMATTVLQCQDFAIVLLDTEGIDAVGAPETMAMSLLTLTTLLSSFLVYNSKKVPQKVDLDKMRCFSQLSASLLAQCGESVSMDVKKVFFSQFLWLLRDVSLKMTDREGKELEPTEFLHTRVLATESGELTDLGKSLVSLFPSLECATLPIPSTKRDIIRDIVEQQDKLKPAFNAAVDALIQQILQKVAPNKAIDGTTTVTGKALAALAGGYVEAVNRPGALPDLDQELSRLSDILKKIPGKPRDVIVIGIGTDRIKLSWEPPEHNPEAVEEYVVRKIPEGGEWEEAVRTEKTMVLVKDLESCTSYDMCVLATNSEINSLLTAKVTATAPTASDGAAYGAFDNLPGIGLLLKIAGKEPKIERQLKNDFSSVDSKCRMVMGIGFAMAPLLCLPDLFTAPFAAVGALVGTIDAAVGSETGDLTGE